MNYEWNLRLNNKYASHIRPAYIDFLVKRYPRKDDKPTQIVASAVNWNINKYSYGVRQLYINYGMYPSSYTGRWIFV